MLDMFLTNKDPWRYAETIPSVPRILNQQSLMKMYGKLHIHIHIFHVYINHEDLSWKWNSILEYFKTFLKARVTFVENQKLFPYLFLNTILICLTMGTLEASVVNNISFTLKLLNFQI